MLCIVISMPAFCQSICTSILHYNFYELDFMHGQALCTLLYEEWMYIASYIYIGITYTVQYAVGGATQDCVIMRMLCLPC